MNVVHTVLVLYSKVVVCLNCFKVADSENGVVPQNWSRAHAIYIVPFSVSIYSLTATALFLYIWNIVHIFTLYSYNAQNNAYKRCFKIRIVCYASHPKYILGYFTLVFQTDSSFLYTYIRFYTQSCNISFHRFTLMA